MHLSAKNTPLSPIEISSIYADVLSLFLHSYTSGGFEREV